MVAKVKNHVYEGDIIQCVLSQSFVGPAPDDLVSLYRAQRHVNPSPYLFFLKAQGCTLIGSSPETMIRLDHRTATLRPIAGTRPRGATEQEDRKLADSLSRTKKNARNTSCSSISAATNSAAVALPRHRPGHRPHDRRALFARHAPRLQRRRRPRARPRRLRLVRLLVPGRHALGAPKIRPWKSSPTSKTSPAAPTAGPSARFFDGNMDFCICIRTAVAEHGRLTIRAGAGIVADSIPIPNCAKPRTRRRHGPRPRTAPSRQKAETSARS
jgi:anthranilate synthase component 1